MHSTIRDSTGIAGRLDAEEWGDLVGAYLDATSAVATRYVGASGGAVLAKTGPGA
jgi:class 3 adenylate cyclase